MEGLTLRVNRVDWKPSWRVLPSRFPPIQLFERIADPADLEAVLAVEALTNPRVRDEVGDVALVPPEERISGPGTSVVMGAFTHVNPEGSRFSDGTFGVFYAGRELDTAVVESRYHQELFLRATAQGPMELDLRASGVDLAGDLHDLRGRKSDYADLYAENDYRASSHLAAALREDGSNGLVYDSVRRGGGQCAAVFRPGVLSRVRRTRHLCFVWDGRQVGVGLREAVLGVVGAPGRLGPVSTPSSSCRVARFAPRHGHRLVLRSRGPGGVQLVEHGRKFFRTQ